MQEQMFCARKNVSSYYGEGEKDIWKAYVRRGMNGEKGQMKLRLLDWGCTVERCRRLQEELRRLEEVLAALPRRQAIRQGPPPMPRLEQAVTPHEAMLSPWEEVPLAACCGRISAAGALGCPPAVPVVLCGQRIDAAAVEVLRYYGFRRCAVLTE